MARFVPNEAGIFDTIQGRGGPVFRLVRDMAEATERAAQFHAPVDSGELRSSIRANQPNITLDGVEARVVAGAKHGMTVHQGRKAIRPLRAPELHFFWKAKGRFINSFDVQSQYVQPRAGRPFLIEGLKEGDRAVRGAFKIRIKRPWRTEGS